MSKLFEGIEGYADMTPEQKLAALEALEKVDTDKEIERYKMAASKANSEAADYKRKLTEKMTEAEREQAARVEELETLRNEVAESRRRETIAQNKARFASLGFDEALASKAAEAMSDGKTDDVFETLKAHLDVHDKAYRDQLLKKGSEPPAGKNEEVRTLTPDEMKNMTPDEINKNWERISASLKK